MPSTTADDENRAFLELLQEEQNAGGKNEGQLVDILEQTNKTTASARSTTSDDSRSKPSSLRARLPFLVKQMSQQNAYANVPTITNDDDDKEDTNNNNNTNDKNGTEATTEQQQKGGGKSKWDLIKKHHGPVKQPSKWDFVRNGTLPLKKKLSKSSQQHTTSNSARHRKQQSATDRFFDFTDQLAASATNNDSKTSSNQFDFSIKDFNISFLEEGSNEDMSSYGSLSERSDASSNADVETPLIQKRARRMLKRNFIAKFFSTLWAVLSPRDMRRYLKSFLFWYVLLIIIPCLAGAVILFYIFGNPEIGFLPMNAAVSWWLLFIVRQVITLHLARVTEYVCYTVINRTTLVTRLLGPFVALFILQSTGWPLVLASWGTWDLCILHGKHWFQKNWLGFLPLGIFNKDQNPDGGILHSELYLRIIFASIIVGLATALKRTTVALFLGRRMLQHYKPQLEETLQEMEFIAEIAELAAETEAPGFDKFMSGEVTSYQAKSQPTVVRNVPKFAPVFKAPMTQIKDNDHEDDSDSENGSDSDDSALLEAKFGGSGSNLGKSASGGSLDKTAGSNNKESDKDQWNKLKTKQRQSIMVQPTARSESPTEDAAAAAPPAPAAAAPAWAGSLNKMIGQLERWVEPAEDKSKREAPSILEILQFRKAMIYISDEYPFSEAFGLAHTRKACVKSSMKVYKRLLHFTRATGGASAIGMEENSKGGDLVSVKSKRSSFSALGGTQTPPLPFDVIGSLAYDDDGELIQQRAKALLTIFLPDKNDKLPEKVFVQAIDTIYKKLRFLRASLSNSSKIDSVLEDMFNAFYWTILGVIILATLGWDPWPLLASFSALVLSFAFALGPSAAKYIEGILLIAIRRPFDIGDRITISGAESVYNAAEQVGNTWLVQDITLTTTTLRFGATSEVSTINNFSIANSRIVNHGRSEKSIITVKIKLDLTKALQSKIDLFHTKIDQYLKDRPQKWQSVGIIHFRAQEVNVDWGWVEYIIQGQHVKAWQELGSVMIQRGELNRYVAQIAKEMGIIYVIPRVGFDVKFADSKPALPEAPARTPTT